MPMMTDSAMEDKDELISQLESLRSLLDEAEHEGTAVYELEHRLFKGLLSLGRELLGEFFNRQGDGDFGEVVEVESGRELSRSPDPHSRQSLSLFGEFELQRYVYAPRTGQRIKAIPLDARLGLPRQKMSYLLMDWTQSLTVDVAYRPAREAFLQMFDLKIPVSLLERQNRALGVEVESYWQSVKTQLSKKSEFVVVSADGKGVPMRRVGRRSAALAAGRSGPKADTKRMAIVGAVYETRAHHRSIASVLEALFSIGTAANDENASAARERPLAKLVRAALPPGDDDRLTPLARETTYNWLGKQVKERDPRGRKPVVVLIGGQHCLWEERPTRLPILSGVSPDTVNCPIWTVSISAARGGNKP